MYRSCAYCDASLGANEILEALPVGRRVAFDAARGRLWVVCRSCERWNLVPEERRWDVIDDCERRFRATRLRVSTDNIGLARLPEGLELVRIGKPLRPELAAWRYGDQFGRRRRQHLAVISGAAVAAAAGLTMGIGVAAALAVLPAAAFLERRGVLRRLREHAAVVARVPLGLDEVGGVRGRHLADTRILMGGPWGDGWGLAVSVGDRYQVFAGSEAIRIAGRLLARMNATGGEMVDVQLACVLLERHGDAATFFKWAARRPEHERHRLIGMPVELRLALEMVSHEDTERRLLEGELTRLELAWGGAEEIASIAESLLPPPAPDQPAQGG